MYSFKKGERLCNYRLRKKLFEQGEALFCYPFRVVFLIENAASSESVISGGDITVKASALTAYPARFLVAVPAKRFRRAVDRNRIKRYVREGYRKHKHDFYKFLNEKGLNCTLGFLYTAKEIVPASGIESKIALSLHKLKEVIDRKEAAISEKTSGA